MAVDKHDLIFMTCEKESWAPWKQTPQGCTYLFIHICVELHTTYRCAYTKTKGCLFRMTTWGRGHERQSSDNSLSKAVVQTLGGFPSQCQ